MSEIAREELQSILNECADCGDMEHHGDVEDYEADMFKGHLFTMAKQATLVQYLEFMLKTFLTVNGSLALSH